MVWGRCVAADAGGRGIGVNPEPVSDFMSPRAKFWLKVIAAAGIAGAGTVITAATGLEAGETISMVQWLVIGATTASAFFQAINNLLTPPPSTPPSLPRRKPKIVLPPGTTLPLLTVALLASTAWGAVELRYYRVTVGAANVTTSVTMDAKSLAVDTTACGGDVYLNTVTGIAAATGDTNIRVKAGRVETFTAAPGEKFDQIGLIRDTVDCTVDLKLTR